MSTFKNRIENLSDAQITFLVEKLHAQNPIASAQQLVACYTSADKIPIHDLRSHLAKHLPLAFIPRHFVRVDEIPKTATGKIARNSLIESAPPRLRNQNPATLSPAPTTTSESAILKAAQNSLGIGNVQLDDDFFEVGGDSLTSIKFIALSRQEGLHLEPQDVFENSTFRDLAAKAESRRHQTQTRDQIQKQSRLFQMRSGTENKSILLIHEIGGSCHYAHYLAPLLNSSWSLVGSHQQTPQDHGQSKDLPSIASEMIDEWFSMHPAGPKSIVSFCWGGLLAYEIAKQLKQRNVEIDRVVIIESGTDSSFEHADRLNWWMCWMRGAVSRIGRRIKSTGLKGLIAAIASRRRKKPMDFRFRPEEGDPDLIQQNVESFLAYQPNPSDVAINLMRTRQQHLIAGRFVDRGLGWRFVTSRLSVHCIPGGHADCVQPPHVEALAERINELLAGKH